MILLNKLIAQMLPLIPKSLVKIFAKKYIAGEKLSHGLEKIRKLNNQNISAILDLLGEDPQKKVLIKFP